MPVNRRDFLRISGLASASLFVPRFLQAMSLQPGTLPAGQKVLVVLQLNGGNDGLNTVIPVRNDIYYRSRPSISLSRDLALPLTDEVSLHPELPFFRTLYHEGQLAILNSVGYPDPDRSHFRSMDIWQSASASKTYIDTGWLGRYLDAACQDCRPPTLGLELDDTLSLAMKGLREKGIAARDPQQLFRNSSQAYLKQLSELQARSAHHHEQPADYLYKVMTGSLNSAGYLQEHLKASAGSQSYPATALGKNLKTIASLIRSGANTRVYYLSIGSFDTHVNQQAQQARLFRQINDAVSAFVADLRDARRFDDLLLFSFSEFGRRVSQNASSGTDHGTANNMFLIGGTLKQQGLLNDLPDLSDLDMGDLKYRVDFRDVYATVLRNWLGVDDAAILGRRGQLLSFV